MGGTIEQLNAKFMQLEKAKLKLQAEIDQMAAQADQANILNSSMEKKAKQFDKIVGEWKAKVDSLAMDLDVAQKETRNASSELFRVKSAYEESVLQLDEVRRENKVLSNEIKDIMDQISEDVPFTKLTKSESALKPKSSNCKLLWKRLKELLNKRKTKYFVVNLNLHKSAPKLNVAFLKRKKNSWE